MESIVQHLAANVGHALKDYPHTIATAESCTGGGLSFWLTSIAGSSSWFDGGFITYSDSAKSALLGVRSETIATQGAVSEQTVREMAEGVLAKRPVDISIAITGIAGPTGGTASKPVGTVWIAWAKRHQPVQVDVNIYPGDRTEIRLRVIARAMEKLLDIVRQSPQ